MCLGAAMFASAQDQVYFSEDFEWLEPWSCQKPAGDTVGENNSDATAQQLGTNKVDEVSTYQALLDKGYSFPICCHPDKDPRKPQAQTYLQRNYIKFGLTGYYSGITFPKMTQVPAGAATTISFDWSVQRQGSGNYDPTQLVVIVKNGSDEKQFEVPAHDLQKDEAYRWIHVSIDLGTALTADSEVTIRNVDSQWPAAEAQALRFHLDNIVVKASAGDSVENIAIDADAPAEYFNLQGIRVDSPRAGLYIVRKGNAVSKTYIK